MTERPLPPGQRERHDFPRFGLRQFAHRLPRELHRGLQVGGDVDEPCLVSEHDLSSLTRVAQTSDFHCVTTWSTRSLRWSGYRFRELFERIVERRARPRTDAVFAILRSVDGYAVSLPLEDLLADDVLLADGLNGAPLSVEHGAPLRLVAPQHYGYKSPKYLCALELWRDARHYRTAAFRFMDHPRARVAFEERGRGLPGALLRYLYRPLIEPHGPAVSR